MWKKLLASTMLALDRSWVESVFHVYCSAS